MLSVKAMYDGKNIKLLEEVDFKEPQKVIVTFLDTEQIDDLSHDLYKVAEENKSFNFLKEPEEDIYTDADLKIRYKK